MFATRDSAFALMLYQTRSLLVSRPYRAFDGGGSVRSPVHEIELFNYLQSVGWTTDAETVDEASSDMHACSRVVVGAWQLIALALRNRIT